MLTLAVYAQNNELQDEKKVAANATCSHLACKARKSLIITCSYYRPATYTEIRDFGLHMPQL